MSDGMVKMYLASPVVTVVPSVNTLIWVVCGAGSIGTHVPERTCYSTGVVSAPSWRR